MKIGNWNVRTLYRSGNIAQVPREMTFKILDIMGISETHWTEQGKMQLTEETIIYSGRNEDNHREGVGIRMLARALIDWLQSVKGSFRYGPLPSTSSCTSMHLQKRRMSK